MKKKTGILGVLIAILLIGIGYAGITAINLVITGTGTITADDDNFNVVYTAVTVTSKNPSDITVTPAAIDASTGVATTSFTVSGMTKKDDTVTLTYTITNKSPDLKASLGAPSITNTNPTYFSASSTVANQATALTANGGTTTQTVTVTALKTPATDDETATITITVVASPQENS